MNEEKGIIINKVGFNANSVKNPRNKTRCLSKSNTNISKSVLRRMMSEPLCIILMEDLTREGKRSHLLK
jgi:hypothetical protein